MNLIALNHAPDADGVRWSIKLHLHPEGPQILISRPDHVVLPYGLDAFCMAAIHGAPFHFSRDASLGMNQFLPAAVRSIVQEALAHMPATYGRMRVAWEPDDPMVPF